jgi:negative regulator of sigma E activity
VHIYTLPVAGYRVTVLGETPAETVMQLAKSIAPKATAAARR